MLRLSLVDWRRLGAHLAETITAIDRPVAPGTEGHHGVVAALAAGDWIHFPWSVLVHTPRPLFGAAHCTAATTALGFVAKTPRLEKLLFARSKYKLSAALHASYCPVC